MISRSAALDRAVGVLVVGAGVFGLWAATRAAEAGLSTLVVDKRGVGAGASGGQLGVLSAHAPDRWNAKKAFQLRALVALEAEIARLEAETGRSTGYGRVGRLAPVRKAAFLAQLGARTEGAERWWRDGERRFAYAFAPPDAWPDGRDAWLARSAAPLGCVVDALAARLRPSAYMAALAARLRASGVEILEGWAYAGWRDGSARLERDGAAALRVGAGAVALAAGYEAFAHLKAATGRDLGLGVKGQSLTLRPAPGRAPPRDAPALYDDGVYVVAQDDGALAVGATSETEWSEPATPDPAKAGFLEKARALSPALEGAEIATWWAGVRPKCRLRDPMIGRVEAADGAPLWAMTGGFKIGLGVAHACADALLARIRGDGAPPALPESFEPAAHLAAADTAR